MAWFRTWQDVAKYANSAYPRPKEIAISEEEYAQILAAAALDIFSPGKPLTSLDMVNGVRIRILEYDE